MRAKDFLPVLLLALCAGMNTSQAEDAVSPTVSIGLFFEFGDEKGTSGGFDLWAGGTYYPSLDRESSQTTGFASLGVQLRTGFIPILTGPNQISPQLRVGIAYVDAAEAENDGLGNLKRPLPKAKLYAIAGYRLAAEFGLDNMDRKRRNERAFRLGIGGAVPLLPAALEVPIPNLGEFLVDVNHDGSIDRIGFDVALGF